MGAARARIPKNAVTATLRTKGYCILSSFFWFKKPGNLAGDLAKISTDDLVRGHTSCYEKDKFSELILVVAQSSVYHFIDRIFPCIRFIFA